MAARLSRAGVDTIEDLLHWFPQRLRVLLDIDHLVDAVVGRWVRVLASVVKVDRRFLPGRRSMVTVTLRAPDGVPFEVVFFNQPYLAKAWSQGEHRLVEGVLDRRRSRWSLKQGRILDVAAAPHR